MARPEPAPPSPGNLTPSRPSISRKKSAIGPPVELANKLKRDRIRGAGGPQMNEAATPAKDSQDRIPQTQHPQRPHPDIHLTTKGRATPTPSNRDPPAAPPPGGRGTKGFGNRVASPPIHEPVSSDGTPHNTQ